MACQNQIVEAAGRLRKAKRVTVLTGAGVSAASGVPTFRGSGGFWESHRPEELATPEAFRRDPALVWRWYAWRRQLIARCEPNRAHAVLASWSRRYPEFTLITQNVDGLHERAGTRGLVRYHGSIWELECVGHCSARFEDRRVPLPLVPPRCEHCGALVRPGVVWFGEPIPERAQERAFQATRCEIFLNVGTSSVVYPAAGLVARAAMLGAYTIEINPEATPTSPDVDLALRGGAEDVLDLIETCLTGGPGMN